MVREDSLQTQPDQEQNYPPLQSGDCLTRPEFERRYAAAPHIGTGVGGVAGRVAVTRA